MRNEIFMTQCIKNYRGVHKIRNFACWERFVLSQSNIENNSDTKINLSHKEKFLFYGHPCIIKNKFSGSKFP